MMTTIESPAVMTTAEKRKWRAELLREAREKHKGKKPYKPRGK